MQSLEIRRRTVFSLFGDTPAMYFRERTGRTICEGCHTILSFPLGSSARVRCSQCQAVTRVIPNHNLYIQVPCLGCSFSLLSPIYATSIRCPSCKKKLNIDIRYIGLNNNNIASQMSRLNQGELELKVDQHFEEKALEGEKQIFIVLNPEREVISSKTGKKTVFTRKMLGLECSIDSIPLEEVS